MSIDGLTVEVINIRQVKRKLTGMKQKAPKVLKLAVNDTAKKARSRLAKEAKKKYVVKVSGFNSAMRIRPATVNKPVAVIRAGGKKIPLAKFSYREGTLGTKEYFNPTLHRYQTGAGGISATGKILKGTRFKPSSEAKLKWFVAKMASGHTGIFVRNAGVKRHEGSKNNPEITEIMGVSIPEMIGNEKQVYDIVKPHIQSDLKEAVDRHVMRALRKEI